MKTTAIVVSNASKNRSLPFVLIRRMRSERAGVAENLTKAGAAR